MVQKISELFQTVVLFFKGIWQWFLELNMFYQFCLGFLAFFVFLFICIALDDDCGGGITIRF